MSSGRVKCTCGWSWNKSDSSKKDMYICYECGRDNSNNMKNGGWLNSYADGGTMQEHQENYNDSEVSLPEGFVGEGYNTKGRNYSPAWGGQFQMGGSVYPVNYVPEAQMGASIPGAVGFSYARVGAPSKGPRRNQTDVTDASAQNGKEMKYYQEGLDWKPKSISKNGGWLDGYDVAQDGKKFKLKDERDEALVKKDVTPDLKPKINRPLTAKQKEQIRLQKLIEKQGEIRSSTPQSTTSRISEVVLNPLTAYGYVARNESLPENFSRGERNTLDSAVDIVNPAFYLNQGVEASLNIGSSANNIAQGNYPAAYRDIKNAGMNTLMTLPLASEYKTIAKGAGQLGRTLGTEEGLLSNAYRLNPNAERLNNINKSYRVAGLDALEDFNNTGVLRSQRVLPENPTFLDRVNARPTSFPSFQKGYADLNYLPEEGGVIFETELPTFKRGEANPVTGDIIGGRHYAHRVIDPETGRAMTEIPGSNINVYGDKPHWWKGYQQLDLPGRNYFEGPLPIIPRNNMIQSSAIDSALEKELRPYISRIGEPSISREEEVFRNVMGHEYRDAKELENTIHFDSNGNIISNPDINKPNLIKKDLSESNNIKHEYFNNSGNKVATFSGTKDPKGYYVNSINVEPQFRRKGIASDIYKNIAKDLQSKNEGTLLSRSTQHQFTDKDELGRSIAPANKLWENLVNKGEAEKFIEGMSHSYKMKPLENGGIIKDDMGQWAHPGEITEIGSNDITMEGVPYDVLGISDTGDTKLMKPGKNYKFKGKKVTEYPMAQNGIRQEQKGLENLDQLTNFTNYNKPQPGGWLNKYN